MYVDIIGRTMLKPLMHFYDDFFIFVFLNFYSRPPKLQRFIANDIRASKLKIFGITKYYETHNVNIKEISV